MVALISLLIIVTISLIVVRIGAVALSMTGLSKELAVFQAQSAFSGVGFTTNESESVVAHPTRRRIIRLLMLMGNAGITSAIAGLVLTFYRSTGQDLLVRIVFVLVGLILLWIASMSKVVNRILTRIIEAALARWTKLKIYDYARLLEIDKGYTVSEIEVGNTSWLRDHKLSELKLAEEGILVLGVRRVKAKYIGAPDGSTSIQANDVLTCYGPDKALENLARRVLDSRIVI